jgi:glycosyltransferase involved in cell wall biosynthesis
MQSPKILLFQEYFSPGYLAGGMQTATKHFLTNSNPYNIRVVTSNIDLNETTAYPGIFSDRWTNRKFGDRFFPVWYAKRGFISLKSYIHFYSFKPDWIYLQGIYGYSFFLLPLLLALWYGLPVIICPHGMLDKGALKQKWFKKWFYIKVFAGLGLHKNIRWQATSDHDFQQIKHVFGRKSVVIRTQLMVSHSIEKIYEVRKDEGVLHLLFFSRITPKKNLHLVLESIFKSNDRIVLSIVGPVEDTMYWENKCIPWMKLLGNRVCYKGKVTSLDVYPDLK